MTNIIDSTMRDATLALMLAVIIMASTNVGYGIYQARHMIKAEIEGSLECSAKLLNSELQRATQYLADHKLEGGACTVEVDRELRINNTLSDDNNAVHAVVKTANNKLIMASFDLKPALMRSAEHYKSKDIRVKILSEGTFLDINPREERQEKPRFGTRQIVQRYRVTESPNGVNCSYEKYSLVASMDQSRYYLRIFRQVSPIILGYLAIMLAIMAYTSHIGKRIILPAAETLTLAKNLDNEGSAIPPNYRHNQAFAPLAQQLFAKNNYGEEIKRLKRRLRNKSAEARDFNKLKSAFIASISHELRTPLNIIQLSSELIAGQKFGPIYNDKYVEYSENIHQASARLLSIISTILDISKAEAGLLLMHKKPVNIVSLLRRQFEELLKRYPTTRLSFAPKTRLPTVYGDGERLAQAFFNIIEVLSIHEPPEISISLDRSNKSLARCIEIIITRHNLDASTTSEVFFLFNNQHELIGPKFTGDGLAISLAQHLLRCHNAEVSFRNHGGGTVSVAVVLPCNSRTKLNEEQEI